MTFIQVTAQQCNAQGDINQGTPPSNLRLHKDLIAIINGQEVYLKGGDILNVGERYYTNFRLAAGTNVDEL